MADPTYILRDDAEYDDKIRALQNSDPANADTVFNPLFDKTLNNIHHVKLAGDKLAQKVEEMEGEQYLPLDGGTMSGSIDMGNNTITGLTDPTAMTDAATKAYVDAHKGTTDHAGLSNLAYVASGHTGFSPEVHTHVPSSIVTDANNRFVTDAQIAQWDAGDSGDMLKSEYATNGNAGVVDTAIKGGVGALASLTTGSGNSAWGYQALYNIATPAYNTAVGHQALYTNTNGSNNTAVGYRALYAKAGTQSYCTAVGSQALIDNLSASSTAVGYRALYSNTTGSYNTAVGYNSLRSNITSGGLSALGHSALYANTDGEYNTAVGYRSLYYNRTGSNNTTLGFEAGARVSSNTTNLLVENSVFIGFSTMSGIVEATNQIVIGCEAAGTASNQITLGNSAITQLRCQVTSITALSDTRIKEEVQPANLAMCLDTVLNLPVTRYKYKDFTGTHLDTHVTGWLADDVEKVFPKAVSANDEWFPELDEEGNEIYETVTEQVPDGVDDEGNETYKEEAREVKKQFKMEDVKNITMTEALPTLWGAVQYLADKVNKMEEKVNV